MSNFFIKSFHVSGLWGARDVHIDLETDVNIIIGPNGSGKTTLLNILRYVLRADAVALSSIQFKEAVVQLVAVDASSSRTVRCEQTEDGLRFKISQRVFDIPYRARLARATAVYVPPHARHSLRVLRDELHQLVTTVWLPVSRRLPVPEDEDAAGRPERSSQVETVDARLRHLAELIVRYRAQLEVQIGQRHKAFEMKVLSEILYNKRYDKIHVTVTPPTEEEMLELTKAFDQAGLLDPAMRARIREHFEAARDAVSRLNSNDAAKDGFNIEDLFVVPLIGRTRSMIEAARQLEEERGQILQPLRNYVKTVNSFFTGKKLHVAVNGTMHLHSGTGDHHLIAVEQLSSGEKQLLILLTEALLSHGSPVVYVADEPELSLHVMWQEKLLPSLRFIAPNMQRDGLKN